jgi:predicted nuclease of predicted toxin-antitoxin system
VKEVRLLLDENLSRRLVRRLADLFPGTAHVSSHGLLQAPDFAIWEFAKSESFSIVTADADFYELATALGPPPKVIWLRGCDYPTVAAEKLERIHDRCTQSHISKVLISLRNQHPVPCLSGHSYRGFALIRGQAIRIVEFLEDPERAVLILQKR